MDPADFEILLDNNIHSKVLEKILSTCRIYQENVCVVNPITTRENGSESVISIAVKRCTRFTALHIVILGCPKKYLFIIIKLGQGITFYSYIQSYKSILGCPKVILVIKKVMQVCLILQLRPQSYKRIVILKKKNYLVF